jgi:hypothetical protein
MITPDEIHDKAKRLYPKFVSAWLQSESNFFPCSLAANKKVSDDYSSASTEIQQLRRSSKEVVGYGYSVRWELRKTRRFGEQNFPAEIFFETADDLLRYISKLTEFKQLTQRIEIVRQQQPCLENWLQAHWKQLLTLDVDVKDLLKVVGYLREHPRPNCFPRELPLSISTKLVEAHEKLLAEWLDLVLSPECIASEYSHRQFAKRYGFRESEPHYIVRVLDPELMRELSFPGCEISLPLDTLTALRLLNVHVVLVENKINLLTFPYLQRGIALGGLGHGIEVLLRMPWLQTNRVTYWGDIDIEGLSILSRLRERYPHVQSILMDDVCLDRWESLLIRGNETSCEQPLFLNAGEGRAFARCRESNLRLEQERIPQAEILQVCASLG